MTTDLKLERRWLTETATLGELYINGQFYCYTLEDRLRAALVKIPGQTCIPAGQYEVVISFSAKFKQLLPLLLNVPMFSGIRIHSGNRPENTEGCILTGMSMGENAVFDSRTAFKRVFDNIKTAAERGKIILTIVNAPVEDTRIKEAA